MKLAVVTSASSIDNEHEIIERMFRHGLKNLHVRKPKYTKKKLRQYLEGFKKEYRDKIIIHSHHSLALSMRLKGIHLTEKHRERTLGVLKKFYLFRMMRPKLHISSSYHKLSDMKESASRYDYVFFGPVFESISKEDHKPSYTMASMYDVFNNNDKIKALALGGVDADKISACYETRFSGVALSGFLWESDNAVERFDEARKICELYKTA